MTATKLKIEAGKAYLVTYPFVRERYDTIDGEYKTWRPGCGHDDDDDRIYFADAEGEMMLIVISSHKPSGYRERVFYIRQWKDPDGNVFGKKNLRMTTTANFRRLCKGFRHRYDVVGVE